MANLEAVPTSTPSSLSSFGPYRRRLAIAEIARQLQRTAPSAPTAAGARGRIDWSGLAEAVARLPESPDPVVVFSELAVALVPAVCEHAIVRVHLGDELARWQQQTQLNGDGVRSSRVDGRGRGWSFTVHVAATDENDPGYVAALICEGRGEPPTPSDMVLVKLVGRCAAAVVRGAGQAELLRRRQHQINSLELAVDCERIVGAAVGVLMAQKSLSYWQAFQSLVAMARDAHLELAAAAATVLRAGTVPGPRIRA